MAVGPSVPVSGRRRNNNVRSTHVSGPGDRLWFRTRSSPDPVSDVGDDPDGLHYLEELNEVVRQKLQTQTLDIGL